jgi:hypothetical protein
MKIGIRVYELYEKPWLDRIDIFDEVFRDLRRRWWVLWAN